MLKRPRARLLVVALALAVVMWIVFAIPEVFLEPFLIGLFLAIGLFAAFTRTSGRPRVAIVGGLVLVCVWVAVLAPGGLLAPELKAENFEKVRVGVTFDDVQELLGGRPGYYGRFSAHRAASTLEGYVGSYGSDLFLWTDDDVRLEIAFIDERVVAMHQRAGWGVERSVAGRIRRILSFRTIEGDGRVDFSRFPGGDDPRHPPRTPVPSARP